ncbi:MAG: DNA-processing protein DprA [Oscillospiraceae bacterium]
MNDKTLFWLWLTLVFGPGNPRIWQLGKHFDNAENFVGSLMNDSVKGVTEKESARIKKIQIKDAKKLFEYCKEHNINIYCYESEGYPEKLRSISNPPAVLFCYGSLDFLNDKVYIAVVGTRTPSEYSAKTTEKICASLVNNNFVLASGMASGIDQIANTIALESNVPTVAVCGRTLEEDYPKNSYEMKKRISQNGVVISECYPGCRMFFNSFLNRNRILVGLSDGVLFCECSQDSKGLDNAKQAIIQGKPVFVIPPHDIFDSRYFGQRDLIRDGAIPVFGAEDIIYNLSYEKSGDMNMINSLGEFITPSVDSVTFNIHGEEYNKKAGLKHKTKVKHTTEESNSKKPEDYSGLSPVKQKICAALEQGNMLADEIALKTGEDISTVLSELVELELDGRVVALAGKTYGIV